jgi:hypothetical protein
MKHAALRIKVRNILIFRWDPCAVQTIPAAHNEYDGYVSGIIRLLEGGCDQHRLTQHLTRLECQEMGFSTPSAHLDHVAHALLDLMAPPTRNEG